MVNSDSEVEDDQAKVSFFDLIEKVHTYSKKKLVFRSNVLIDAYHNLYAEKEQLINKYAYLKFDKNDLEVSK